MKQIGYNVYCCAFLLTIGIGGALSVHMLIINPIVCLFTGDKPLILM